MTLKADIKYKSNWQQGAVKGMTHLFPANYESIK